MNSWEAICGDTHY